MSYVNCILKEISHINTLVQKAKSAEKSKAPAIINEADVLFRVCCDKYIATMNITNSNFSQYLDHANLHISMAEAAFSTGNQALSRKIIERYLQSDPQQDQYFCRSKLLLGLIINYESRKANGLDSIKFRKLGLREIMISLDIALRPENLSRYKFIVYNSTCIAWEILQSCIRPGRAFYYIDEIVKLSNALETINDADMNWRVMYLSAQAFAYDDGKQSKQASDCVDKAIAHVDKLLASSVSTEQTIAADLKKVTHESEEIMSALRKLEEFDLLKNRKAKVDPDADPDASSSSSLLSEGILPHVPEGMASLGMEKLELMLQSTQSKKVETEDRLKSNNKVKLPQQDSLTRLYMQRIHVNIADAKKIQTLPQVIQSLRTKVLVQLQCISSNFITEKEWPSTFAQAIKDLESAPPSALVAETLADVSRMAWRLGLRDVACKCMELAENLSNAMTATLRAKLDLCQVQKITSELVTVNEERTSTSNISQQRLNDKQMEGFSVSKRIEALKLLEKIVGIATSKIDDKAFLEEVCVVAWNAMIPLLQPHLRLNVHRILQLIANALEVYSSSLFSLRMRIHFELAKCEEQTDFVLRAKEEGVKALECDYGNTDTSTSTVSDPIDRNRIHDHIIKPYVELLGHRSSVYDAPADVEGKVNLLLQQIKDNSKSKAFQLKVLTKAAFVMLEEIGYIEGLHTSTTETSAMSSLGSLSLRSSAVIPEVSIEDMDQAIKTERLNLPADKYDVSTQVIQKRFSIFSSISKTALLLKNIPILFHSAKYLLSFKWDPADIFMKSLLDVQVDEYYLLADAMVEAISKLIPITANQEESPAASSLKDLPDPRALGVKSDFATPEIIILKELTIQCILKGITLSLALKDEYGVQNGIIYFWNLHAHIFRNNYYPFVMPQLFEAMKKIFEVMESFVSSNGSKVILDEKLKSCLIDGLANLYAAEKLFPQAIDVAMKGCVGGSIYSRRRLCELAVRFGVLATSTNATSAAAPGGGGGKAQQPKPIEPPKFDHVLLTVFGLLAQIDMYPEYTTRDQVIPLVDRAIGLMTSDVGAYLKTLNTDVMSKEEYDQFLEMQAECWTRLTRIKIVLDDIHGAQNSAEQCIKLITDGVILQSDERQLSPRVWRWISVCERYFGVAIAKIIKPEGQDISLQNELRLAALRHFTLSCTFGKRANREELIITSAINGWNVSIDIIDAITVRTSFASLITQVISLLLTCKANTDTMDLLKLQLYLALIEGQAQDCRWGDALSTVLEAFDNVPSPLQKPLWKWRVVAMSKKGRSVLDGLQKLKESNISLQARVYVNLARASSNPKQQIEAYSKALDILQKSSERVDYILETVQWMASAGADRMSMIELLQTSLDCIYELDEDALSVNNQLLNGVDNHSVKSDSTVLTKGTARSNKPVARATMQQNSSSSSLRTANSNAKSIRKKSVVSKHAQTVNDESVSAKLNFKHCEIGTRALAMTAMLEFSTSLRIQRCIESLYFINRSIDIWNDCIQELQNVNLYEKLSNEEKALKTYNEFKSALVSSSSTLELQVPADPLKLLSWTPNEKFLALMKVASVDFPLQVPTTESISAMPLTIHYLFWLANILDSFGFCKKSLFVLGWLRSLLMFVPCNECNLILASIHVKAMKTLINCGLTEEINSLPIKLGLGGIGTAASTSCIDVLTSISTKSVSDFAGLKAPSMEEIDHVSILGFSSWTKLLEGVDIASLVLETSKDLFEIGIVPLSKDLAFASRKEYIFRNDKLGEWQALSFMTKIDLIAGKTSSALSSALAAVQSLSEIIVDAKLLYEFASVAMNSYGVLRQVTEAKEVALTVMDLINVNDIDINIPNNAIKTQVVLSPVTKKQNGLGSTSVVQFAADVNSSSGNGPETSSNEKEPSLDKLTAFALITFEYIDILAHDISNHISNIKDFRGIYTEVLNRLQSLQQSVAGTAGIASSLYADILQKKSTFITCIILSIHQLSSKCIPQDNYLDWITSNLDIAVQSMKDCAQVRRGNVDILPYDERTYASSFSTNNKPVCNSILRKSAICEIELSKLLVIRSLILNSHSVKRDKLSLSQKMNPPEKYLFDTQSHLNFVTEDFVCRDIISASHSVQSSLQLLADTDFESDTCLMSSVTSTLRFQATGSYSFAWDQDEIVVNDSGGVKSEIGMTSVADSAREELLKQTMESIAKCKLGTKLILGLATLCELFGSENPSRAAFCLMQLQSITMREWLYQLWSDTLNPTCEVACALKRLRAIESQTLPQGASQTQVLTEQALLNHTSVAWKRLNVSANPISILQSALPASTFVLCIQMNPFANSLYASVGTCNNTAVNVGNTLPVPGSIPGLWCVDKLVLTEDMKRSIQTIICQHKIWREDTVKFVAAYGESMPLGSDFESDDIKYSDKSIKKAEWALEVRLRAILDDMNSIFLPILGEDSKLGMFLKTNVVTVHPAPAVPLTPAAAAALPAVVLPSALMLLDCNIQQLPWEGLEILNAFQGRVSRDFSIHLLGHRYNSLYIPPAVTGTAAAAAAAAASANANSVLPHVAINVFASSTKAICDPLHEDDGFHQQGVHRISMRETLKALTSAGGAGITGDGASGGDKWKQIAVAKGALSFQDWIGVAQELSSKQKPSALFFYGSGRLASMLNPSDMLTINFETLGLVISCDNTHNDTSIRRSNAADNLKQAHDIALEMPMNAIALLSLSGVGALVSHQWGVSFAAQQAFVKDFYSNFTRKKQTHLNAVASSNCDNPSNGQKLKKWVKLARVSFGLINIMYNDT